MLSPPDETLTAPCLDGEDRGRLLVFSEEEIQHVRAAWAAIVSLNDNLSELSDRQPVLRIQPITYFDIVAVEPNAPPAERGGVPVSKFLSHPAKHRESSVWVAPNVRNGWKADASGRRVCGTPRRYNLRRVQRF